MTASGPRPAGAVRVRPLTPPDVPALLDLIDALADYEKLPRPGPDARARLTRDATATPPRFSALLGERDGRVVAYAIYFETYSTFLARPTLYLEDLFVLEPDRRHGVGRALFREIAREALNRGCGRVEWQVLTWNTPALDFYRRLGATHLGDWQTFRLTADQFERIAATPIASD